MRNELKLTCCSHRNIHQEALDAYLLIELLGVLTTRKITI
jgi:hypothetical protein